MRFVKLRKFFADSQAIHRSGERNAQADMSGRNGNTIRNLSAWGLLLVILFSQFFEVRVSIAHRVRGDRLGPFVSHLLHIAGWSGSGSVRTLSRPVGELGERLADKDSGKLRVQWNGLGKELVEAGVIDRAKFKELYAGREEQAEEIASLLDGSFEGELVLTYKNASVLLNLLWALGLGNKNHILESGPMTESRFGGVANFASTGGWTLASGAGMEHYSQHAFLALDASQQELVEQVARNVYRPCCNNPAFFPDCNHGTAILGLLALGAFQGFSEEELYAAALTANSFWFASQYEVVRRYQETRGLAGNSIAPRVLLGAEFSSAAGWRKISTQVINPQQPSNSSCGV